MIERDPFAQANPTNYEYPESAFPLLVGESPCDVSQEDQSARLQIQEQLTAVTDEVFGRTQMIQPETGCFNRCSFCSQHAGRDVWSMTQRSLGNFVAAMRTELTERFPERAENELPLIGFDRARIPGVVFPYLDNDAGNYPLIDEYVRLMGENLNVKTVISTVGFSAINPQLQEAHSRIATDLSDYMQDIRLSFTPYTHGWRVTEGSEGPRTTRDQFVDDFSNTLRTYHPFAVARGRDNNDGLRVDLRFRPSITTTEVDEISLSDGTPAIASNEFIVIGDKNEGLPQLAMVAGNIGRRAVYSANSHLVTVAEGVFGDTDERRQESAERILEIRDISTLSKSGRIESLLGGAAHVRQAELYRFKNADGPYFGIDPDRYEDGSYNAVQLYPKTEDRPNAGIIDSRRPFLNTIVDYKSRGGLEYLDPFTDATEEDIENVLLELAQKAEEVEPYSPRQSSYIRDEILPMVSAYAEALIAAGYSPSYFFDPACTKDTGIIVNQGRAFTEFAAISSHPDSPLTPDEEKSDFIRSKEGSRTVRVSPNPAPTGSTLRIAPASIGKKNTPGRPDTITFSELSFLAFQPDTDTSLTISGIEIAKTNLAKANSSHLFPGSV